MEPHVRGALLAVGAWFLVVGWMRYPSTWDLGDPVREGWSSMIFSWTLAAVAAVTIGFRVAARRAGSRAMAATAREGVAQRGWRAPE